MNFPNIIFRSATLKDLAILKHWDEQPHVLHSDPNDDWNWEIELQREPQWRKQVMAELDGKPLGFIQIIDAGEEETHYWGDVPAGTAAIDIWIGDEKNLNNGYGTIMMNYAIEQCFADEKVDRILIDPLATNTKAHRFYQRIGFQFVRTQQFDEDSCFVYQLERDDWENKKATLPWQDGY